MADSWLVPFEELTMQHEVGRGAYGRVYKAKHLHTTVAAKQVSKEKKSSSEEFDREVAMLKLLRHPNIVLFMGVSETETDYYIIQEFVSGGGMNNLVRNQSIEWPWKTRVRMALETAQALLYLHMKGVLHRDVKSENVFLDRNTEDAGVEQQRCKLADFGLSLLFSKGEKKSEEQKLDNAGTAPWKAPEVNLKDYDTRADIFSFGMMLAEMSSRVYGTRVRELINNKGKPDERGYVGLDPKRLLTNFPKDRFHYPPKLMDLAIHCCAENPDNRPTMENIVLSLESLLKDLHALEDEAEKLFGGEGAKFWASIASENLGLEARNYARREYLCTALTDRLWESTNRNLGDTEIDFIKSILKSDNVSLAEFKDFWSFLQASEKVIKARCMLPLWTNDFFHGFIGKEETIKSLEESKDGTFICRFTTSAPGKFAISYKTGGKISHLMVALSGDGNGFLIGSTSYSSFINILDKSRVFTHVFPDRPLEEFQSALQEAAGVVQNSDMGLYGTALE